MRFFLLRQTRAPQKICVKVGAVIDRQSYLTPSADFRLTFYVRHFECQEDANSNSK